MADIVGVMNAGEPAPASSARGALFTARVNRFVASFVGLANTIEAGVERSDGAHVLVDLGGGVRCAVARPAHLSKDLALAGKRASLAIRPENIRLSRAGPAIDRREDAHMSIIGTVAATTFSGNLIDYFVDTDVAGRLRAQSMPPIMAQAGDKVVLSVAASHCVLLED